jgi:acid phosphatase (class A)
MLPEKKAELYRRIADYARSRMIAGVHFRSDVEAGKMIGAAVVVSLFAKPDFLEAFDGAKTCVRKAVGLE